MSASLEEAALEFEDPQMAILVVLFSFLWTSRRN
jgi:hypothetical protein